MEWVVCFEKDIEICLEHPLLSKSAHITKLEPLAATIERPSRIRRWIPQRVSTQGVYEVSHMNLVVLTVRNDSVFVASQGSSGNKGIVTNWDG